MSRGNYVQRRKRHQREEVAVTGCCFLTSIPLALLFFAVQVAIVVLVLRWFGVL